jgi:hypothetical protein
VLGNGPGRPPAGSQGLMLEGYPLADRLCTTTDHPYLRAVDVFAHDHSFIYRRSRSILISLVGYRWPLETYDDLRPFKRDYNDEDRERMDLTLRLISAMDAYCSANGIRFLLVDSIARWEIDRDARSRLVHMYGDIFDFEGVSRALTRYSASHGIEFISLPDLARERGLTAADLMYREDTIHLDARGVRFLSDQVAERISSLGWLGSSTQGRSAK